MWLIHTTGSNKWKVRQNEETKEYLPNENRTKTQKRTTATKKIEIGNLPYKEFKEIVIKMTEIRIK